MTPDLIAVSLLDALGPTLAVLAIVAAGYAYMRTNVGKAWEGAATGWKEQAFEREKKAEALAAENIALLERVSVTEARVNDLMKRPDLSAVLDGITSLAQELGHGLTNNIARDKALLDAVLSMSAHNQKMSDCLHDISTDLKLLNGTS